jgi:hypothetical protein
MLFHDGTPVARSRQNRVVDEFPIESVTLVESPRERWGVEGMALRRTKQSDAWHWCSSCSSWPTEDYETSPTRPYYGSLCCECKSKEEAGTCLDAEGRSRSTTLALAGFEALTAAELELVRDEMRKSNVRTREELERLEGLLILARQRERASAKDQASSGESAS